MEEVVCWLCLATDIKNCELEKEDKSFCALRPAEKRYRTVKFNEPKFRNMLEKHNPFFLKIDNETTYFVSNGWIQHVGWAKQFLQDGLPFEIGSKGTKKKKSPKPIVAKKKVNVSNDGETKKRGRPPKVKVVVSNNGEPKKRGRPPKVKVE